MADSGRRLLILGLGNVLCGDDGLGVAAVHEVQRCYRLGADVEAIDGGTLGLTLLSVFEGANDVILVDAVAAEEPPGTLVRLEGEAVAPAVRTRLSVHQVGVADLLDSLRLLDSFPERLVLLGLVPDTLELGLERTADVERNLPLLVEAVVEEARRLGYPLSPQERDALAEPDSRGPVRGPVRV